jgi:hypothetical protein
MMASSILSDTIPCVQLQVEEASNTLPSWVPIKQIDLLDPQLEEPSMLISLPKVVS